MTDVRAKFPMANEDCDICEFVAMLADWCGQYVDEIAIPVMVTANELYEDLAIRRLVHRWWDEQRAYRLARRRYLEGFADYDRGFPPNLCGEWHRDNQHALNEALNALLVR